MAGAKDASEQRKMEFGLADGSVRDRRVQLGRVVSDLRLTSDAAMLLLLVFDQTANGIGPAWAASDELVLGHALGPKCAKTGLYKTRRALTEAGILSVTKDKAEGTLRRHFKIDWASVYAVRGLPLPDRLRAVDSCDDFSHSEISPCENSHRENSYYENSQCENNDGQNHNMSGRVRPCPDAGARLSSCLVFLSSVVVDDKTIRQDVQNKAREIHRNIFSHRPGAKLDDETRQLVAEVAAVAATIGGQWAEWIDYAVAVTKRKRANTPGAYLRRTLRFSLVEFAGLCDDDDAAAATMGRLLSAARPLARAFILADVRKPAALRGTHGPPSTPAASEPKSEQLPPGSGREMLKEAFAKTEIHK